MYIPKDMQRNFTTPSSVWIFFDMHGVISVYQTSDTLWRENWNLSHTELSKAFFFNIQLKEEEEQWHCQSQHSQDVFIPSHKNIF